MPKPASVWILFKESTDSDGYPYEEYEEVFLNKPSTNYFDKKFKNYELRPGFTKDLVEDGYASNLNWNYDPWVFYLRQEKFADAM